MIKQSKKTQCPPRITRLISWLTLASSFMLGIFFGYDHHWVILVGFFTYLSLLFLCSSHSKQIILCMILFAIGYTRLQSQRYFHHKKAQSIQGKTIDIEAHIIAIEPAQHTLYRYTVLADVGKAIDQEGLISTQSWRLHYYTKQKPQFVVDDTITISKLKIAKAPSASFASYLIKEGVHGTAFAHDNETHLVHRPLLSIKRTLDQFKHTILNQLRSKCSSTTGVLLCSIFLGNRVIIKKQYQRIKNIFCDWGIMHYLARSGIHLIIFILLLQLVLQWIPMPLLTKHIITLCITGAYALLSWPSISFARAYTSFLWYKLCHIFGLQVNMIYIVLMLSCLFLFINPSLLFFLDFQLSFGLTLILAILNSKFIRHN